MTKIPGWDDLRNATRYQAARDALIRHPEVKRIVGPSLGGSVALELDKNYRHITSSRTHGAPVWNPFGSERNKVDRYRNYLDPVSLFDRSAVKRVKWNPFESSSLTHDYSNIAKDSTSSKQVPVSSEDPDGSISLIG